MASFKILRNKQSNYVVLKGTFENFSTYSEIKQKIFENCNNYLFKKENLDLKPGDNFKLVFDKDKLKDVYFPEELHNAIWNSSTYEYLRNELLSTGSEDKFRFYIENINNSDYLNEVLDTQWTKIYKDIIRELNIVKLDKSKIDYEELKKKFNETNEEHKNNKQHSNVICSHCFKKDFTGKRFICSECKNYNLCQECEKKMINEEIFHEKDHVFIQVNKPLDMNDFSKYSNVIGNYCKEFHNILYNYFELELMINNNGENNLKDCYILPVRYGDEYLSCASKIIKNSVEKGMSLKINLDIQIPYNNKKCFKGYFRMFTPNGIPFGNVVYIQVFRNN